MSKWNGKRFSVYTSEEKSALGLIKELGEQTNFYTEEVERIEREKTDLYGDHKGTWQGLNRPTLSEEGAHAQVEKNMEDINLINSQLETMETQNASEVKVKKDGENELKVIVPYKGGSGTGDCTILTCEGKNIIIDFGSGGSYFNTMVGYLKGLGINRFDYAFISHYHGDHVGGLQNFINNFDFSNCLFYVPPQINYDSELIVNGSGVGAMNILQMKDKEAECYSIINTYSKGYIIPSNDTIVNLTPTLQVRFLNCDTSKFIDYYPITSQNGVDTGGTIINNFSMITEFIHGAVRVLLTGDLGKEGQDKNYEYIKTSPTLYKVEHHGCNNIQSTSEDWLARINPVYAYISGGHNKTQGIATLNKLYRIGCIVASEKTLPDGCGNVIFTSNCISMSVTTDNNGFENLSDKTLSMDVPEHIIQAGDDMNSYVNCGSFLSQTKEITNTLINIPVGLNKAFRLDVSFINATLRIEQKITTRSGAKYYRNYYDNTWSAWREEITPLNLPNYVQNYTSLGTLLAKGEDLNNITPGVYYSTDNSVTSTLVNIPNGLATGFKLIMSYTTNQNRYMQEIHPNINTNVYYYVRRYSASGWGNWFKYNGTIVD